MRTITLPNNETVTLREFLDRYKFIKAQGFKYKCSDWFGFSAHRGLVVMWVQWWINKKINDRSGQRLQHRDEMYHFRLDQAEIERFYETGEPIKVFASQLCQKRLIHLTENARRARIKAFRLASNYGMGWERLKKAAKHYTFSGMYEQRIPRHMEEANFRQAEKWWKDNADRVKASHSSITKTHAVPITRRKVIIQRGDYFDHAQTGRTKCTK